MDCLILAGLTDSGWIDSTLFDEWFSRHFLAYAPKIRTLLYMLLLDGHSSHYQPSVIRRAAEEEILIFCLPPHTSHVTQPLDNSLFSSLKSYWKQESLTT